ncbi:MAG: membrane protein insertase YidC [Rhodomicrobium sp.]
MENNRNFILAVVLSLAVLLGWQVLYVRPMAERARLQQHSEAMHNAPKPSAGETASSGAPAAQAPAPTMPEPGAQATGYATREDAIAASPRIPIDSPALLGSINLKGARIDDVILRDYKETVNPNSPDVVLLSPSGSPHPYFTYTGWLTNEPGVKLPNENTPWQQEGTGPLTATHPVVLRYDNGEGLIFHRTISVDDHYMFTISDQVENKTGQPVTLRPWGQVAQLTEPKTLGYSVLHEGPIGVFGDSGLNEPTFSSSIKNFDPSKGPIPAKDTFTAKGGWLGFTSQYWAAVLVPNQSTPYEAGMFGNEHKQFYADYLQEPVTVAPGSTGTVTNRLFAGAKEVKLLEKYRSDLGIERFNKLVDWGWFFFLTEPMFYLMDFLYQLVGNFGLAIMLTTVIVKAAFFPLANKSFESMSKMKKLQPEMKKLQERFKDDKARQQEALMKLYRDEKVNPMAGCLPIFIQIPVFFSLYKVLLVSIEMRHAPFIGWIKDLSAPDPTTIFNLFGLIPWTPPAWLPMLGVLPLVMGVSMWVQMRLNPTPPDPVQAQIFTWMPVVFTFMMARFPAGLILYWTWNNILSFTQQAFIMKRQGVEIDIMHNVGIKKVHGRVQQVRSRIKNNGRSRTPAE